jgi:CHAD domain-containing protein
VARALSAVREADVRRDLVLGVAAAELLPPQDVARLRALLDRSRRSARAALRRERARPEWTARLLALARGLAPAALQVRSDAPVAEVLKLANGPWRKARRLVARLPGNADDLHRLRLCLKHCRYALEVMVSIRSEEAERALEGLRRAQDCLGEHRDAVQAVEWVRTNESVLGRALAKAIVRPLKRKDRALRRQAVLRASEAVTLHDAWRAATRSIRRDSGSRRDRA